MNMTLRSWPWLATTLLLSGCVSAPPFGGDSGPDQPIDLSQAKEPIPRSEPFSPSGNPDSYVINGQRYYVLKNNQGYHERGIASWYGRKFHGRRTSNGEIYDMYAISAAHKTLPLPTYARVTNIQNGRSITVRINDRGPFHENRLIDLSYAAASKLGIAKPGTGWVEVTAITPGNTPPTPLPAGTGEIYLQVGAFGDRNNAERLTQRLRAAKLSKVLIASANLASGPVFRVRLGPLKDVREADSLTDSLNRLGFNKPHIVTE